MSIKASSFNRSIKMALVSPPCVTESLSKIRHIIGNLPDGKLYASDHGNAVSFYTIVNGHQKYISKRSKEIYPLARKTYLLLLLHILELTGSGRTRDIIKRKTLITKLQKLMIIFERGNLELERIVLTSKQYKWFAGNYIQKHIDKNKAFRSTCDKYVRSKSERDIANANEKLAVPFHYEERTVIFVRPIVTKLYEALQKKGLQGRLYEYTNGTIIWRVPPELQWMNTSGSIWKTYDAGTGTIAIFNDFKIMLANGDIIIWEHEGLMGDFVYRCNASERAAIIKLTETIDKGNLIETYEHDIDSPEKLIDIIERHILPRLWF